MRCGIDRGSMWRHRAKRTAATPTLVSLCLPLGQGGAAGISRRDARHRMDRRAKRPRTLFIARNPPPERIRQLRKAACAASVRMAREDLLAPRIRTVAGRRSLSIGPGARNQQKRPGEPDLLLFASMAPASTSVVQGQRRYGLLGLKIVGRILASAIVLDDIEAHFLAFDEDAQRRALKSGDVNEHIRTAAVGLNEAEAFVCVKKLYGSGGGHDDFLSIGHKGSAAVLDARQLVQIDIEMGRSSKAPEALKQSSATRSMIVI